MFTIVRHCAVFGEQETKVRSYEIGEPRPYAQYALSVVVTYLVPRKRKKQDTRIYDDVTYITILDDAGATVWDSRSVIPCNMEKWNQTAEKMAQRAQRRADRQKLT